MAGLGVDTYRFSFAWPRIQPDGTGPGQRRGAGVLRPAGRRAARAPASRPCPTLFHWDTPQALQDAGGWLEPRHRRPLRRLRGAPGERFGDRVDDVDHDQRADRRDAVRLRAGHARARASGCCSTRSRSRTTSCSRTAGPSRPCGRAARPGSGSPATTRPPGRPSTAPRTSRRPGSTTTSSTGCSPTRCCSGRYPDGFADLHARPGRRSDLAVISRADRLVRAQPLLPVLVGARGRPDDGRCRSTIGHARRATRDRLRLAGRARRASRELLVHAARALRRRAAAGLHHRERLLVRRRPDADGRVHDQRRVAYLRRLPARARSARSRRASTSAATSSGRCSTTSSGPRATPSASASSTSTSTTQVRTPEGLLPLVPRRDRRRPRRAGLTADGRGRAATGARGADRPGRPPLDQPRSPWPTSPPSRRSSGRSRCCWPSRPRSMLRGRQGGAARPGHRCRRASSRSSANPLFGAPCRTAPRPGRAAGALGASSARVGGAVGLTRARGASTPSGWMVLGWALCQAGVNARTPAVIASIPDQVPRATARRRRRLGGAGADPRRDVGVGLAIATGELAAGYLACAVFLLV